MVEQCGPDCACVQTDLNLLLSRNSRRGFPKTSDTLQTLDSYGIDAHTDTYLYETNMLKLGIAQKRSYSLSSELIVKDVQTVLNVTMTKPSAKKEKKIIKGSPKRT